MDIQEKEVKNKAIQKQLFVDLDDQEKVICDCLQNKGKREVISE